MRRYGKIKLPAYTAECSLHKSIRGYVAAPTRAAVGSGAVVPSLTRNSATRKILIELWIARRKS